MTTLIEEQAKPLMNRNQDEDVSMAVLLKLSHSLFLPAFVLCL